MDTPSTFLTLETLRTLAGQVLVVVMLTQLVKATAPTIATYWLRTTAVVNGIVVHFAVVWTRDLPLSGYALAFANGVLVAMVAMKAAELVKGETPPTPPVTPPPAA